jgi:hypothetical protein
MFQKSIIKNPNGTYSFVGSNLDPRLCFETQEGEFPSDKQIEKVNFNVPPKMAGLKVKVFQTEQDALDFEKELGI